MTKSYKILFFNFMIMGTLIAISSYSWFSMWMGLEINMLSVIPLFIKPDNSMSTEAGMKYFISQATASLIILFSMIMIMMKSNFIAMSNNLLSSVMNSMFMLKMGAAPLHFWFPEVMEGLSWMNCLIILTWQKISPMIIIFNNKPTMNLMMIFIVSSIIVSTIMSFNQTSLRKIMSFSSINHIGWMISAMLTSMMNWSMYFILYSILSINITSTLMKSNTFFISQMMNESKKYNSTTMINFLSMGGLPPFTGFLPKWMIINSLTNKNLMTLSVMLIMSSLIMLFVYMRMFFPTMMMSQSKKKPFTIKQKSSMILKITMISNMSLIIFTLMMNLN